MFAVLADSHNYNSRLSQENVCDFTGCSNIPTEKCPDCGMRLCLKHKCDCFQRQC